MKVEDYRNLQAQSMSEKQFQSHVVALAHHLGWKYYHVFDSRRSAAGWPDLALVRERFMVRELKTATGVLTAAQEEWLSRMSAAGVDAGVWRPADLMSGRIKKELRG